MQDSINMPERWYSTKEICSYLGISRDTLLTWIAEKNMPAHRVGRNWKFKPSGMRLDKKRTSSPRKIIDWRATYEIVYDSFKRLFQA